MNCIKHFFAMSLCLFITLLMANQLNAQVDKFRIFQIESGIIEYKYSGTEVGKSIHYFDNYGNRSAVNLDKKNQDGEVNNGWIISYGEYQYMFDPSKPNEGVKLKNPIIEWLKETSGGDMEKFTEETCSRLGMKKEGTEKFLGKECIAYKGGGDKMLTWNGIMMLMDVDYGGGRTRQEVTSIKVNVPVDPKYFEIPKNIKFSDLPFFGTEGYEYEDDYDEDEEE